MSKKERILWILIILWAIAMVAVICMTDAKGETEDISHAGDTLYVTATRLNGRSAPRKTGFVECIFDYGDRLIATGRWSKDHKWVEVLGGESGEVWVDIRYVTEKKESFTVMSLHPDKIKIRKRPIDGKVKGYLKKGKELEIDQVVLGWGHCSIGWIDLDYLIELGD